MRDFGLKIIHTTQWRGSARNLGLHNATNAMPMATKLQAVSTMNDVEGVGTITV